MCSIFFSKKTYVSELEEARTKLSKEKGNLKGEIKLLKEEKKRVEDDLSIVEVTG